MRLLKLFKIFTSIEINIIMKFQVKPNQVLLNEFNTMMTNQIIYTLKVIYISVNRKTVSIFWISESHLAKIGNLSTSVMTILNEIMKLLKIFTSIEIIINIYIKFYQKDLMKIFTL